MALAERLKRRGAATPGPDAMTLAQHLGELRRRLLITAVAFLIAAVVAFFFYDQILSWLRQP
jgi:Sec-independent protein secretion pathway component TatC